MHRATNSCRTTIGRLLYASLLLFGLHAAAFGACQVQQRARVPLQDDDGHLLVPVTVNGITAQFVLDTGAERSLVTPEAVRRLDLRLDQWAGTRMQGVGGIVEHPNALPRSLSLGGVALQRRTVTHDTSLTVGPFPTPAIGGTPIAGLLGRDFLSVFDLELDLTASTLTLYEVRDCTGAFLPWKQPYVAIAAQQPIRTALVVPVRIDGKPLSALLDTGASASLLTARGMFRLGLAPERMAADRSAQARGVGPRPVTTRQHRFISMQIGPELVQHPLLWAAPVRVVPFVDMLLGADWLAGRRVWISFATSQLFVAAGPLGTRQ